MKHAVAFAAFLLCLLLVLFATPAMQAAQAALSLWWGTLLPTLFPFFVCATLIERTGALHMLANRIYPFSKKLHISHYALPVLLLGGITGYPSGARLCGMLQDAGCVSEEEAERLASTCNLCSPMFLMGAVAGVMFQTPGVFAPLAIGHYGAALVIFICLQLCAPLPSAPPRTLHKVESEPLYRALPITIANGMRDMLKVGGTVLFFFVLAELLMGLGVFRFLGRPLDMLWKGAAGAIPPSQGVLLGILEMTGGCHLLLQSGLPVRMAATLCAFLISFGGLSIFVQAMAFLQFKKPWRYLFTKLAHGILSAILTYYLVPRTAGALEVFSPGMAPYAANALTGVAVLVASALGMLLALLLALLFGKKRRAG